MEQVDIVDNDGKTLYVTSKEEAHTKGLLHKTVIAELVNSKGEFVFVRQTASRQDPGMIISTVGGHMSVGETEETALKREVEEEIGLQEFTYERKGQAVYSREVLNRKENHLFILYEVYSDEVPTLLSDEVASYVTYSKEDLKKDMQSNPSQFSPALLFVINTFYPDLLP